MPGEVQTRNLILGTVEDLEWEAVRPFMKSLQQTPFAGDVRLFTAGLPEATLRRLGSEGAVVEDFIRLSVRWGRRVYQPLRSLPVARACSLLLRAASWPTRDENLAAARLAAPISIPNVARFFRYYRFLSAVPNGLYRNVMLTDVRDVYFQLDPFDYEIGDRVNCFLEDPRETLSSQTHNREWLAAAYGDRVLADLGPNLISCAGVTIGSFEAILAYLRAMVNQLISLRYQSAGADQAVHNYIIYKGLGPPVELVANGEGAVLTLGIMPRAEVAAALPDSYANVRILHQYDRHPELAKLLLDRLAPDGSP